MEIMVNDQVLYMQPTGLLQSLKGDIQLLYCLWEQVESLVSDLKY